MLQKEAYFNPKLSNAASDIIEFNYNSSNPNGWHNFDNNTDWIDAVKQTGYRQNHYISLTGGGEKANFRIGAGYDHETGSIIKQQLDRLTSRVALDYFVSDRIKIVTNPFADRSVRKPNALQNAAAELFNQLNVMREDITNQGRHIQAISKVIQKKLNL